MSKSALTIISLALIVAAFFVGRETAPPEIVVQKVFPLARAEGFDPAPAGSVLASIEEPDAFVRAERLAAQLQQLGPDALPEVQEILASRPANLSNTEATLLIRFWANHEPAEATMWATSNAPTSYRMSLVRHSLEHWAFTDPEAAVAGYMSMKGTSADARIVWERSLVRGWYWSGRPGLWEYIAELGPSVERQRAIEALFDEMVHREGSDSIRTLAESIPDEDHRLKLAAYRRASRVLGRTDILAAVEWCAAHCDGPFGDDLEGHMVRNWTFEDPLAVFAWLQSLPDSKDKMDAAGGFISTWLNKDPEAAQAWLADLGSENVEPWMSLFSRSYAIWLGAVAKDYDEAVRWAMASARDQDRRTALTNILRRWRQFDREGAVAWVGSADLSDPERERLMGIVKGSRATDGPKVP